MAQVTEKVQAENVEDSTSSLVSNIINDIVYSPLNFILLTVCIYLIYKLFFSKKADDVPSPPPVPQLPTMKKRDMTLEELRKYDGKNEEGRVCVAVNGKVFDVTKGKHFYGPGGPYAAFAGRDASRGLATFSVEVAKEGYDDLSDLNSMQMESVREWETQFQEKYHYVGRLLKPNEEPTDYSDEEDASQDQSTQSPTQSSKKNE